MDPEKLQRAFRKPNAQSLHSVNSIKSFDFFTLYTTIPHAKLKSKLKEIINQCFFHKNGNRRFQYVVISYKDTYFVRDHSDAPQKYSDADVIKMLEYLIDNIFVEFGGRIFQQTIGIPVGTDCAPLLANLFLYSYEAEFVQRLLQAGKKHLAQQFNFTYRYIDDVLSLKNTKFAEYLEFIYPRELEIKETTETAASSSYLDVISTLTMESLLLGFTTNGMTSIFPLLTFHSLLHQNPGHTLLPIFSSFRPMDMVGEACLPSNAYYPRTPDYTLYSGVHVCWSEHSDSSFVYGFMSLDYGLGTMTATT